MPAWPIIYLLPLRTGLNLRPLQSCTHSQSCQLQGLHLTSTSALSPFWLLLCFGRQLLRFVSWQCSFDTNSPQWISVQAREHGASKTVSRLKIYPILVIFGPTYLGLISDDLASKIRTIHISFQKWRSLSCSTHFGYNRKKGATWQKWKVIILAWFMNASTLTTCSYLTIYTIFM